MTTQTLTQRRSSRSQPLSTLARRSLALLAGLIGLATLYGGAQLLVAGIAHYQASAFLENWEKQTSKPSAQAWLVAENAIQRAINTHPAANGKYLEKLGYIEQWREHGTPLEDSNALASRQAAVQALRQATQARPTWPDAWAGLAYAKLTVLEFDDEFTHALQQAQHFGPWRIGINRRIAEIGLMALPVLNTEQTAIVFESAQRTAHYSAKERQQQLQLAIATNSLTQLCQALQDNDVMCNASIKKETPEHE